MTIRYEHDVGWLPITQKAVDQLKARGASVVQVKEKLGGLRIYFDCDEALRPELKECVADASRQCSKTCEVCGAAGSLRKTLRIQTLCDEHTTGAAKELSRHPDNRPAH